MAHLGASDVEAAYASAVMNNEPGGRRVGDHRWDDPVGGPGELADPGTVTMFGDAEPEDGYDAGDRAADRLDVLHRVVAALEALPPDDGRRAFRIGDALRLLASVSRHRQEVAHLRARLEAL